MSIVNTEGTSAVLVIFHFDKGLCKTFNNSVVRQKSVMKSYGNGQSVGFADEGKVNLNGPANTSLLIKLPIRSELMLDALDSMKIPPQSQRCSINEDNFRNQYLPKFGESVSKFGGVPFISSTSYIEVPRGLKEIDYLIITGWPDDDSSLKWNQSLQAEAPKMLEKEGKEVPGNRGYRYYGAARDLPGVRELFEEDPQPVARKSRGELMKLVDVSYYGNCDEDDGVIVPQEAVYEQEAIAHKIAEWKYRKASDSQPGYSCKPLGDEFDELDEDNADTRNIYDVGDNPADIELMRLYEAIDENNEVGSIDFSNAEQLVALINDDENTDDLDDHTGRSATKSMSSLSTTVKRAFVAHVPIYSQEQIEAALVAQRKREILEKYMSSDLLASMAQTGEILGFENSDEINSSYQVVNDSHFSSIPTTDSNVNVDLDTNEGEKKN
ncbi:pre-mRNA-splicing factor ISY1 [Schistosoma bovis]|uniref:Pre-mRNA-splicing factor ISY1 n=3 Tax=Schistosoma TaxID=6181 RepID=A0A430QFN9_SCHBO|nr:pre-mRNA-splicing factor ISY1 [Schistosoma bovis]